MLTKKLVALLAALGSIILASNVLFVTRMTRLTLDHRDEQQLLPSQPSPVQQVVHDERRDMEDDQHEDQQLSSDVPILNRTYHVQYNINTTNRTYRLDHQPVGTFNGFDLYYVDKPPKTKVHCIGDNYRPRTAFKYRTCEYENLCFDLRTLEFVIYEEDVAPSLPPEWRSSNLRRPSRLVENLEVNAKPVDTKSVWYHRKSRMSVVFSPTIRMGAPPPRHYLMDATQIPFFRYHIGFRNPGHHGWQELLSLFTLIDDFDKYEENIMLTPLRRKIKQDFFREGNKDMMVKMGSKLMGHSNYAMYNPYWEDGEFDIQISDVEQYRQFSRLYSSNNTSNSTESQLLVCAKHTLTGMGQFGSHATHHYDGSYRYRPRTMRVKEKEDLEPLKHGYSAFFRRFRKFMMKQLGVLDVTRDVLDSQPAKLLFAMNVSDHEPRASFPLDQLMHGMESRLDESRVQMEAHVLHQYSIEQQVEMISQTKIFFTAVGGGTFPCIFLPEGAHLVLFYVDGYLDWDFWNNMAHLNVHWVPIAHATDPHHYPLFQDFIEEILGVPSTKTPPRIWN